MNTSAVDAQRPPHAGRGRPKGSPNKTKTLLARVAREALDSIGGAQIFVDLYNACGENLTLKFSIAKFLYEQAHGRAAEQTSPDDPERAVKIVVALPRNSSPQHNGVRD
jgi:hypothetical protein